MRISGIFKPEYMLRPRNIISRLRYWNTARLPSSMTILVRGKPFRLRPHEIIGRHILHFGLFDLLVSEALTRLAAPGELAVDVGANIGYMTRVLAQRVGSRGQVMAFEPHPEIFSELTWNTVGEPIMLSQAAVSDRSGTAKLRIPANFAGNRGIASLEAGCDAYDEVKVPIVTLDSTFASDVKIGVMKIDIEGHELSALRGADRMLRGGQIRDIVFEEHDPDHSEVATYLTRLGYHVFRLEKGFFAPKLRQISDTPKISSWESPSLLATLEPQRAKDLFSPKGWHCWIEPRPCSA